MAKWLWEYMGFENTRPLPVCLYNEIRKRYTSAQLQGYVSGQERSTAEQ
jgi:hypothetical protein